MANITDVDSRRVSKQATQSLNQKQSHLGDKLFHRATQAAALLVLATLAAIIVSLIIGSWPSFKAFGFSFVWSSIWNPPNEQFGAWPAIFGTLLTSAIAMLIAVPVGICIAFFLTEISPYRLRRPVSIAIELLAGVPSIIYGIWGLFVFAPFLKVTVEPFIIDTFGQIPLIGTFFSGPPFGVGIFTAGLILAVMVLPLVTSISRDVFGTVPAVLKEAGYGGGCTTWEVFWKIVLPYSRVGVVGGCMLALGRALGETMATTFVIGNSHRFPSSILSPGTTISASIANEFTEADGDIYSSALIELGLLLFVITFIVLAIARYMLARTARKNG